MRHEWHDETAGGFHSSQDFGFHHSRFLDLTAGDWQVFLQSIGLAEKDTSQVFHRGAHGSHHEPPTAVWRSLTCCQVWAKEPQLTLIPWKTMRLPNSYVREPSEVTAVPEELQSAWFLRARLDNMWNLALDFASSIACCLGESSSRQSSLWFQALSRGKRAFVLSAIPCIFIKC